MQLKVSWFASVLPILCVIVSVCFGAAEYQLPLAATQLGKQELAKRQKLFFTVPEYGTVVREQGLSRHSTLADRVNRYTSAVCQSQGRLIQERLFSLLSNRVLQNATDYLFPKYQAVGWYIHEIFNEIGTNEVDQDIACALLVRGVEAIGEFTQELLCRYIMEIHSLLDHWDYQLNHGVRYYFSKSFSKMMSRQSQTDEIQEHINALEVESAYYRRMLGNLVIRLDRFDPTADVASQCRWFADVITCIQPLCQGIQEVGSTYESLLEASFSVLNGLRLHQKEFLTQLQRHTQTHADRWWFTYVACGAFGLASTIFSARNWNKIVGSDGWIVQFYEHILKNPYEDIRSIFSVPDSGESDFEKDEADRKKFKYHADRIGNALEPVSEVIVDKLSQFAEARPDKDSLILRYQSLRPHTVGPGDWEQYAQSLNDKQLCDQVVGPSFAQLCDVLGRAAEHGQRDQYTGFLSEIGLSGFQKANKTLEYADIIRGKRELERLGNGLLLTKDILRCNAGTALGTGIDALGGRSKLPRGVGAVFRGAVDLIDKSWLERNKAMPRMRMVKRIVTFVPLLLAGAGVWYGVKRLMRERTAHYRRKARAAQEAIRRELLLYDPNSLIEDLNPLHVGTIVSHAQIFAAMTIKCVPEGMVRHVRDDVDYLKCTKVSVGDAERRLLFMSSRWKVYTSG